tara:strand:- start:583 stop:864 length:282 start_codon:yes stop_codon:yes gene_type:complete
MSEKRVSMEGYQWGHFGAIIADVVVFSIIAYLAKSTANKIRNTKKFIYKETSLIFNLKVIFWLSLIFAIITLFGLWPIFNQDTDEDIVISKKT